MIKTTLILVALVAASPDSERPSSQDIVLGSDAAQVKVKPFVSHPYTLTTCAVSGKELGSMGDPIVRTVEGREIKLCCKGCIKPLEKNAEKIIAKVDAAHAEQQRAYYPQVCVVSGEPLIEDGKDIGVDIMIGNRLFRTCCKMCAKKVKADPNKFAATLDASIIKAQAAAYPLPVCLVNEKGKLGEDRVQRVVSNRLVQFCCDRCSTAFDKEPATFLAKLDTAWISSKKKGADRAPAPLERAKPLKRGGQR